MTIILDYDATFRKKLSSKYVTLLRYTLAQFLLAWIPVERINRRVSKKMTQLLVELIARGSSGSPILRYESSRFRSRVSQPPDLFPR